MNIRVSTETKTRIGPLELNANGLPSEQSVAALFDELDFQRAVQGELRQALIGRLGAVAFAGVGAVAPSFSDMGEAMPLPSAGLGLRFQPTRKSPVNISVDYAWGKHSSGLYLYVGEAF